MGSEKERIYLEYLVLHCQHHDGQAWQELVNLYEKRLFYFVKQIVGQHSDALNVLQEVWLKAFRSIGQLQEPSVLTAWLYRIARNASLTFLRRKHNGVFIEECDDDQLPDLTEPVEVDSYAAEKIHHALQCLTWPHREVLTLYYLEDFRLQEIAVILSIPVGTVRSRMHYAKKALKAALEKENGHGK